MPFPFRAVVLSSAVALVPVTGATAQNDEPQPPTMEQGPGLTPLDQGSSPSDVRITQDIRRALTRTNGFSVDARNVKIITKDGVVTLRGEVKNDSERAAVVAAARRTPGVTQIDEDLHTQPGQAQMSDPKFAERSQPDGRPERHALPEPERHGNAGHDGLPARHSAGRRAASVDLPAAYDASGIAAAAATRHGKRSLTG
jgi:hypothetical protein